MAVARMGCCTSLLYGTTGASKNTVNLVLTSDYQLGTGLSCLANRYVADQSLSSTIRECPSSTGSDPRIGHATGTRGRMVLLRTTSMACRTHLDMGYG